MIRPRFNDYLRSLLLDLYGWIMVYSPCLLHPLIFFKANAAIHDYASYIYYLPNYML